MEHVNGWCFRGIYKGGLWEDDLHVSAHKDRYKNRMSKNNNRMLKYNDGISKYNGIMLNYNDSISKY